MAQRGIERFERVVLPHLDDAYTLARYLLRDEHDAQDVVQEAVLRALRYFEGYRNGDARAWLLAIVRNTCLSWLRSRQTDRMTVPYADAEHAPQMHDGREADARAIAGSERERIERALAELPAEFQEVIILREVQRLSYKEVSEVTGVPIGTVMSRLSRARRRLADALGDGAQEAS